MPRDPKKELETLQNHISDPNSEGSREVNEKDRELLLEFSNRLSLLKSDYSDHRNLKLLRHCTRISEEVELVNPLAESLESKDAAEKTVRWIHGTYDNEETNRDYRVALRVFGKRIAEERDLETDDNDIPLTLSWVSGSTSNSYKPAPDQSELFSWDEVDDMIEAAPNPRDAAMVALMMDAGPRGGEFFNLDRGDVTDAEHGLQLSIDGKTGERSVTLIPSSPYVTKWLEEHPGDKSDSLWSKLQDPKPISRQRIYQTLRSVAEKAGIDIQKKPPTPTNFRKSNATYLASVGANAALIEDRQGRNRESSAVSRYVAIAGPESEQKQYAELHGHEVELEQPEERDIVVCPRCNKPNPPEKKFCMFCRQALDYEGAKDAKGMIDMSERLRTAIENEFYEALAASEGEFEDHEWDAEEAEELIDDFTNTMVSNTMRKAVTYVEADNQSFEDMIDDLYSQHKMSAPDDLLN